MSADGRGTSTCDSRDSSGDLSASGTTRRDGIGDWAGSLGCDNDLSGVDWDRSTWSRRADRR